MSNNTPELSDVLLYDPGYGDHRGGGAGLQP